VLGVKLVILIALYSCLLFLVFKILIAQSLGAWHRVVLATGRMLFVSTAFARALGVLNFQAYYAHHILIELLQNKKKTTTKALIMNPLLWFMVNVCEILLTKIVIGFYVGFFFFFVEANFCMGLS